MDEENEYTKNKLLIAKAIMNAIEAYEQTFYDEGLDSTYNPILKVKAGKTDADFEQILETITWENTEYKN